MTAYAISLKERFALLCIARDLIAQAGIRRAVRAAIRREFDLQFQELRYEEHIVLRKIRKRRHALTAFFEYRRELLAFFVVQHERHSRQARGLRATPVFAVTARAIFQIKRLAFFGGCRGRRGAKSEKLAHVTAATAAASGGFLRVGLCECRSQRHHSKKQQQYKTKMSSSQHLILRRLNDWLHVSCVERFLTILIAIPDQDHTWAHRR